MQSLRVVIVRPLLVINQKHDKILITIEYTNLHPALSYTEDKLNKFFQRIFLIHENMSNGVLSVAFLSKAEHSKLHGDFLQDYRPTDVITFPADPENEMVGEICVSVDQAREEAESRDLTLEKELSLYLIHGWLHLVGFDDRNDTDRKNMRIEEANALAIVEKDSLWPNFLLAPQSFEV